MSILDQATSIIINKNTAQESVQPLIVGGDVNLDGVSVALFDINPEITTRENIDKIKEVSDYAKDIAGVDWVDWVKDLSFQLGIRPGENLNKLHRYIAIKKSIKNRMDELEAMS